MKNLSQEVILKALRKVPTLSQTEREQLLKAFHGARGSGGVSRREVKDIVFYIENKSDRVLSFLVKKYHDDVYVKENDIDTLLDDITQSDVDYGGVLVQKGEGKPEVMPLTSIAFCDQTDILGGPIAFKFNFTPSKLRKMQAMVERCMVSFKKKISNAMVLI